jgi:drug/metabolite transporter (DMT)-like permease
MGFGYGLALSSSLLQGTADFIGGTLSRRISPIRVVALSQAFALLLLLPVLILAPRARPPLGVVVGAAAAGVLSCASLLTQYAACAAGAFGVVATIGAASAVVPVAVDVVRYGPLPVPHLVGSVAAVTGAALAAAPNRYGRAVTTARSVILAGTSAICFGLTLVFVGELAGADNGGIRTIGAITVMRMSSLTLLVVVWVIQHVRRSRGRELRGWMRRHAFGVAALGLADVGATLAFASAAVRMATGIAAVLASLFPVVTLLLARYLHGERLARRQHGGVVAACLGMSLIAVPIAPVSGLPAAHPVVPASSATTSLLGTW